MNEGKTVAGQRGAMGWEGRAPLPYTPPRHTQAGRPTIPSAAPAQGPYGEVTPVATSGLPTTCSEVPLSGHTGDDTETQSDKG